MPTFSRSSKEKLATCHPDLQRLMNEVIKTTDIIILCGHRGEVEQNAAFANHTSQLKWPKGKHNSMPSKAVDVAPWPLDWDNEPAFCDLAVLIKRVASEIGVSVEWGGDWKTFVDLPHYQLK